MGCSAPLSNRWKASRRRLPTNCPLESVTTTPTSTRSTVMRMPEGGVVDCWGRAGGERKRVQGMNRAARHREERNMDRFVIVE
jgi:hypothetical protein